MTMAHTNQNLPRPLLREEGPLDRSRRMNRKTSKQWLSRQAFLWLAWENSCPARDAAVTALPPGAGRWIGSRWEVFGADTSCSNPSNLAAASHTSMAIEQLYDTLVNLQSGPRLFGQELTMRPMTRGGGGLFDTLYLNSFGFGGDPNDMARLRIEKGKWYNFVALYRRDQNFFDFNLFANPLNLNPGIGAALKTTTFDPTTMPWYVNSPHLQDTTRNMGDFNLTLFPQSVVRIRLGYARNVNQGTLDTTLESHPHHHHRTRPVAL